MFLFTLYEHKWRCVVNEYDYHIGAEIHCTDGRWGQLAKVALEPETWQVTHLIAQTGLLLKEAHVVPVEAVTSATDEAIHLSLTTAELQQCPPYKEKHYEVPAESGQYGGYGRGDVVLNSQGMMVAPHVPMQKITMHEGIDQTLALLKKGTPVKNMNGEVGKLDHVITDAGRNEVTHLVMRHGLLFPDHLIIPVGMITEISEESIFIEAIDEELKTLIPYSPQEIVGPDNGSESLPASRPETGNGLTADALVADRVATALRTHPVTANAVIEVINQGGLVTLNGVVPNEKTRQTAEKIAAQQDNVVKVVNDLVIRATDYA
jgi:uncharacterized protein YrrD